MRREALVLVATLLALAALSGFGALVAPSWEPPRLPAELAYPPLPPAPETLRGGAPAGVDVRSEETGVVTSDETLPATVYAPIAAGRHPAVVFVHGSGAGRRAALAGQAERLARSGIVTLVYDKRTAGYSVTRRDYGQLAQDALAAVRQLRGRADVDPARVGLWGVSEGGWVVAIAGSSGSDLGFVILVSAPGTSPLRQSTWALDTGLRRLGAPDVARQATVRAFGLGGFGYVHHDARPALQRLRVPVLAIYGTDDAAVPPVESARLVDDALTAGGNHRCTIRFFAGADHDLRIGGDLAPGYLETMAAWVHGLPGTGTPAPGTEVAGATPTQQYLSADVPAARFGVAGLVVAYLLIAAGYLAAPIFGLVARLRRRPRPPPARPRLRRRLRWLLACGLTTLVALNVFMAVLVGLVAVRSDAGWVADAGWLAVRAVAVLTTLLLVSTVAIAISACRAGWRPHGVERVRLGGVCAATALALLVASYWEVFTPAW